MGQQHWRTSLQWRLLNRTARIRACLQHRQDPGQEDDGLITDTIIKQGTTELSHTVTSWQFGPSGAARPMKIQNTNDANQTNAIVYDYDDLNSSYDNVAKVHEYDFAALGTLGTELRRTEISYLNQTSYWNRGLIRLPLKTKVWDIVRNALASQTDYSYDEATHVNLNSLSGIIQYTDPSSVFRGDLTTVTQYSDTSNPNAPAGAIGHSSNYDTAGNLVSAAVDCCQQKTFTYSPGYFYAYPTSTSSGAGPTVTVSATYDLNTGLLGAITDENNQTTTNYYCGDSLRPNYVQRPDGSTTHFYYSATLQGNGVTGGLHYFTNVSTQLDATRMIDSYRFYDGRGAVTQAFDNYAYQPQLSASKWSAQAIEYDVMGRVYRSGNPYYTGGYGWSAVPGDAWTTSSFDNLGRVTQVTSPSGDAQNPTTTNGETTYSGTNVLVKDGAGKQRVGQSNALGQLTDLWEITAQDSATEAISFPNHSEVTAGYRSTYKYDVLNHLVQITQAIPNQVTQNRYFKFDSTGRPTYERPVEQDAPQDSLHYAADTLTGNNYWSRKIVYNSQSLVQDTYDARSNNTHFIYDGLNRITQINYNLPNGSPDPATPSAYYWYDSQALPTNPSGFNRGWSAGRLVAMTYGGTTSPTGNYFGYDQMGRTNAHRQATGSTTYATSYTYNLASELLNETYPSGRVMSYAYDDGGRLSKVVDATNNPGNPNDPNNVVFDNGFTYAPHGGLLGETFGNSATHSLTYNRALQTSQVKLAMNGAEKQRYDYSYGVVNQNTGSVDTTKNNGQLGRIDATINGSPTKEWDQRYVYDALGRLATSAEYRGDNGQLTWQSHYDYDRFGNRFQYQNNVNLSYTQVQSSDIDSSRNRFVASGSTPTTYDPAGDILTDTKFRGMNFTYDASGRQTFAEHTDHTSQQSSVYDCSGKRVQTAAGGTTRTAVYDIFEQNIADYSNGSVERENIYRGEQLLATKDFALRTNFASATNGATATAQNYTQDGVIPGMHFQPAYANDGVHYLHPPDGDQAWRDEHGLPSWLQIDFNGSNTIDEIDVFTVADYPAYFSDPSATLTFTQYGATAFNVQYWNGTAWATVPGGTITGNNLVWKKLNFSPITTSKIRVVVNAAPDGIARIVELEAWGTNQAFSYVMQDVQGSTRLMMNSNGAIIARHDYQPFGEEIGSGTGLRTGAQGYGLTDTNRQKYGLTERDVVTGLDHTPWRKYESIAGRWTSPDPYNDSAIISNPQSFNRYSYVQGDPVNFIDPTGLFCLEYDTWISTSQMLTITHHRDCYLELNNPWTPLPTGPGRGPGGGLGGGRNGTGVGPQPQNNHSNPQAPTEARRQRAVFEDCVRTAIKTFRKAERRAIPKIAVGTILTTLGALAGGEAIAANQIAPQVGWRVLAYSTRYKVGQMIAVAAPVVGAFTGAMVVDGIRDSRGNNAVVDQAIADCAAKTPQADHSTLRLFFSNPG